MTVSLTVTFKPFQSAVALAMSSPIFLGDCMTKAIGQRHLPRLASSPPCHERAALARQKPSSTTKRTIPSGPTLGASVAAEATSPPTARIMTENQRGK